MFVPLHWSFHFESIKSIIQFATYLRIQMFKSQPRIFLPTKKKQLTPPGTQTTVFFNGCLMKHPIFNVMIGKFIKSN